MNELKIDIKQSIIMLSSNGWSQRRIAQELGINRETVAKYRREARASDPPKPAIVPTGSRAGRKSQCEPFREQITLSAEAGLSAQRIYQDLVT